MSIESELSKLRHPSNSKNFPILGSVPPSREFKFPMTEFLKEDLGEYADDAIANEIPEYYPQVASIIFNGDSYIGKMGELNNLAMRVHPIPAHEYDFFCKVISALSDLKIAEARSDAPVWPKLLGLDVNKTTETGMYTGGAGGNVGSGESYLAKARQKLSLFFLRLSGVD